MPQVTDVVLDGHVDPAAVDPAIIDTGAQPARAGRATIADRAKVDGVTVEPREGVAGELHEHLTLVRDGLRWLEGRLHILGSWGDKLAGVLGAGGRVLVAGNGGSAALAQHLTSELVGRYHRERPAYSAIALTADTASLTALGNDYGFEECFARQVAAHGRGGDIFVALSSSGRSPNLLRAADTARQRGLCCWAMTGPEPNPLAAVSDEILAVDARLTATVQEVQQVAVHLLCRAFDRRVAGRACSPARSSARG